MTKSNALELHAAAGKILKILNELNPEARQTVLDNVRQFVEFEDQHGKDEGVSASSAAEGGEASE